MLGCARGGSGASAHTTQRPVGPVPAARCSRGRRQGLRGAPGSRDGPEKRPWRARGWLGASEDTQNERSALVSLCRRAMDARQAGAARLCPAFGGPPASKRRTQRSGTPDTGAHRARRPADRGRRRLGRTIPAAIGPREGHRATPEHQATPRPRATRGQHDRCQATAQSAGRARARCSAAIRVAQMRWVSSASGAKVSDAWYAPG